MQKKKMTNFNQQTYSQWMRMYEWMDESTLNMSKVKKNCCYLNTIICNYLLLTDLKNWSTTSLNHMKMRTFFFTITLLYAHIQWYQCKFSGHLNYNFLKVNSILLITQNMYFPTGFLYIICCIYKTKQYFPL